MILYDRSFSSSISTFPIGISSCFKYLVASSILQSHPFWEDLELMISQGRVETRDEGIQNLSSNCRKGAIRLAEGLSALCGRCSSVKHVN